MQRPKVDVLVGVGVQLGERALKFRKGEVQCIVFNWLFGSLESSQEDIDFAQIPGSCSASGRKRCYKGKERKASIPASKFHKPSIVWKSSDNLACMCLEGLNLGIGEVILVQVSDVLKQFQTPFCNCLVFVSHNQNLCTII